MKKVLKTCLCIGGIVWLTASNTMPAFAGTWKSGEGANQNRWWYDNENGTCAQNGWQWIDGNGDGIAESYCFDENGWLLTSITTPDGYTVNADGAWVENGVVQTKELNIMVAPISEADFVVSGDNSITNSDSDGNIILTWENLGYTYLPYAVFVTGDSMTTARGITFEDTKNDVIEKYGTSYVQIEDIYMGPWYASMKVSGLEEAATIAEADEVLEYKTGSYGITFYFNQQDVLTGVLFFNDTTLLGNE